MDETKESAEPIVSVKNMWQLKELCEKEFGSYAGLFLTTLKTISGYEPSSSMVRPDPEEAKNQIKMMMEETEVTPEIVDNVNAAIAGLVEVNQTEVDFFKTRPGKEAYVADCKKVIDVLKNKQFFINEQGVVSI